MRHLGWNQYSHGLKTGPWNPVVINALRLFAGVLEYPKGAAAELLDDTLKLRHCTLFLPRVFPHGLPRVGNGGGERWYVTLGHVPDDRSNVGKRVRLTRKTRPGASSHVIPDPGHPTLRRWKRLRSPSSDGEGSEVGGPRNLFPRHGVG